MKVLSFGGGVQSVTIAYMCINGDLPKPDYAIFADPQWESKATYDYINSMKPIMERAGIPLIVRSKGNIRTDALSGRRFASLPVFTEMGGKIGMLRRQCTNEYKIQVVWKAIRELLNVPKHGRVKEVVDMWLGISRDEAIRMKPSRVRWIRNVYPLIDKDMSRQGCKIYLKKHKIPEPPKSACIGCPFHDDGFWRDMQKDSPVEFEDACKFDDQIRLNSKKGIDGKIYLHRSAKPLREIKFDDGNYELWGEECEGHCGL
jgi:hypothetical protein